MKHKILIFLLLIVGFLPYSTHAVSINIISTEEREALNKEITRGEAFSFFASFFADIVPESSSYIDLNFTDVLPSSKLYKDLQVLVYLDLINNNNTPLHASKKIDVYTFGVLANKILGVSISWDTDKKILRSTLTKQKDLQTISKILDSRESTLNSWISNSVPEKIKIFQDVYTTILESHYDRDTINSDDIIYSAIEGLANGTDDEYTTYFPPTKSKDFHESINGEFEGIGSYVEMPQPWKLIIISPIVDSPSEKAGLRGWDIITHVNGKEITRDNSIHEAVSWIKWPKGTTVTLTILRNGKSFDIDVVRDKIIVKDIDTKFLRNNAFYIQIRNFWPHVWKEFFDVMKTLQDSPQITKVIIDVRNNPGGYLGEVSKILSHAVPKGEATAIVDYGTTQEKYKSTGYEVVNFSNYDIRLIQNSGSASASEILVGTLKDYYPDALIIGEQSFGKGSVQSLKEYSDGSSLKITIAKWFTGKTKTGIDKVGITPDILVEFDEIADRKGNDIPLETALKK